jgi:hypothetical protein
MRRGKMGALLAGKVVRAIVDPLRVVTNGCCQALDPPDDSHLTTSAPQPS